MNVMLFVFDPQILNNWKYHKPKVASYWLVKLDATKQRKVKYYPFIGYDTVIYDYNFKKKKSTFLYYFIAWYCLPVNCFVLHVHHALGVFCTMYGRYTVQSSKKFHLSGKDGKLMQNQLLFLLDIFYII